MGQYKRHIGLILLIAFAGSMTAESALAVYNAVWFANTSVSATGESVHCVTGFVQSQDGFNVSQDSDYQNGEKSNRTTKTLFTSNCHSSLQLLASSVTEIECPVSSIELNSSVLLLSTQLFVHQVADPPRLG
ncbi:MAG: hypothetical protein JJU46_04970 [Balneolaceae bacterium]|nr:hypothetical protein [Balneolaceae bacterium]MCH8548478.1 hypothetical protein [Balneolaceae bacterium]